MKMFVLSILAFVLIQGDLVLVDFNTTASSGSWYIVNDDVMGGVSSSGMEFNEDGTATFLGKLSGENYGGFASIRMPVDTPREDSFKGVSIRLRGDGNTYSLRFRTNNNFDGYAYQAKVQTEKDAWKEFKVPFNEFEATYRGRTLSGKPELKSEDIAQFGLLIADKQFGTFAVDIDWIKLY